MSRMDDSSVFMTRWSKAKLMRELKRIANFETASFCLPPSFMSNDADTAAIKEATRIYRNSWLNPLIEEIEKRFVK